MDAEIPPNLTKVLLDQPPPLQAVSAPNPTVDLLHQQIPLACLWNLAEVIKEGIRHEGNMYGYLNSLFTSIFLPSQRFQVNPQYPLRPNAPVHSKNISIGSTGGMHFGRGSAREEGMLYPEFVISKPSPRGVHELRSRINALIAIIEVKKSDGTESGSLSQRRSFSEAVSQLVDYATRVQDRAYSVADNSGIVASYLIYGEYYTKLIRGQSRRDVFVAAPLQYIWEGLNLNRNRAPLSYRLCEQPLNIGIWNSIIDVQWGFETEQTTLAYI